MVLFGAESSHFPIKSVQRYDFFLIYANFRPSFFSKSGISRTKEGTTPKAQPLSWYFNSRIRNSGWWILPGKHDTVRTYRCSSESYH